MEGKNQNQSPILVIAVGEAGMDPIVEDAAGNPQLEQLLLSAALVELYNEGFEIVTHTVSSMVEEPLLRDETQVMINYHYLIFKPKKNIEFRMIVEKDLKEPDPVYGPDSAIQP